MSRSRFAMVIAAVAALLAAVVVPDAATAASATTALPTVATVSLDGATALNGPDGPNTSQTFDAQVRGANRTQINLNWGDGDYDITMFLKKGFTLRTGVYRNDVGNYQDIDIETAINSHGDSSFDGQVDVLDLATDSAGRFTRFDILFQTDQNDSGYFGEIEAGEPEQVLAASARELTWPADAVNLQPSYAGETVENTSAHPVALGRPQITGPTGHDWTISDDGCSGRTLAPGATCGMTVAFSPLHGGPRAGALVMPAGDDSLTVPLTGSAVPGTSSFTTSGDDDIDRGSTLSSTPLLAFGTVNDGPSADSTEYQFQTDPAGFERKGCCDEMRLTLDGPKGTLKTGTHPTGHDGDAYALDYTGNYGYCASEKGTETIHRFDVDRDGRVSYADIDFKEVCDPLSQSDPTGTITGHLVYGNRTDRTPPGPPTHLAVSGHTARWQSSTSKDRAFTIVRVLPSTGGDSAESGWLIAAGSGTSAALPALHAGRSYRLVGYTVDKTGNTSAPDTISFTAPY